MRLINTDTLEIEEFGFGEIPNYAILSHRWGNYELTLQDVQGRKWTNPGFNNEIKIKAFEKISQCCVRAKSDSFKYVWIDSCCIDKTSSAELSEAINSMYLWYYKAERCYAYLSDVLSEYSFKESEWFTRGWTLQELLAPAEVYFLNQDWKDLGTKESLQEAISDQTNIPVNILSGADLETATIAQRMSWASKRKTSRIEDRAYSLMGIFGINMPLLYGEGERAFIRLQEEIMRISNDHSLFAWRSSDARGGLLATSPDAFISSSNIVHYSVFGDYTGPLTVSSRGIQLEVRFIGRGPGRLGMAILHCAERGKEDKPLAIYVKDTALTMELFERVRSESFEWIDLRKFRRWQYPARKICIRMGRLALMSRVEDSGKQDGFMKEIYDDTFLLNLMNTSDTSELFRAAQAGDQDVVWLLLTRSDVTADLKDATGLTALWHAVMGCHEVLVKMLLARSDVNPDAKNLYGQTPLSWAAEHGHEAIFKLLLEKNVDIEAEHYSKTPLLLAIENGHVAIVEQLLEKGAEKSAGLKGGFLGGNLLLVAVMSGHEAVVRLLLEKDDDIEAKDVQGITPLALAAARGHEAVVRLLLEKGAGIEAKDDLQATPLVYAAESGHEAVVKLLLEKGADIEARYGDNRMSLLLAAKGGHEAVVKLLLEKGANIEAKDDHDRTPLLLAAENGHEAVVKALIEKDAGLEAKDHKGKTALALAAARGHEAVVKLLLEKGANIEAKDDHDRTALLLAAENGHEAVVKALIEKDAGLEVKDHKGKTALALATENGHDAVTQLLLMMGAAGVTAKHKKRQKQLQRAIRRQE